MQMSQLWPKNEAASIRPNFRGDINGLRACAVVAVILYHFGVPGFAGGFIGVDLLFVISGFLMTGIVIRGLEKGDFSIAAFYLARAKRIVPALAAMCAVLLMLGWFVLMPPDYKTLASDSIYSLAFLSNIEFWQEAGYFDAASHEKWLLHTWSLSVEWQFYLILPMVLLAVWRRFPGQVAQYRTVVIGIVLSLGAAVLATDANSSMAFYLLPTRAWEMLAGGLVFLAGSPAPFAPTARRWLAAAAPDANTGVVQWTYSACPFIRGLKKTPAALAAAAGDYRCAEFIGWAEAQLKGVPSTTPVVIIGRYAQAAFGQNEDQLSADMPEVYFSKIYPFAKPEFLYEFLKNITASACQLAAHRTMYMMRPIPEMGIDVPKNLSRRMAIGLKEEISVPLTEYCKRNAWSWAAQDAARDKCGVKILDPLPYLCQNERRYGSKNGFPLYHDDEHLSEYGNKLLVPIFPEVFKNC